MSELPSTTPDEEFVTVKVTKAPTPSELIKAIGIILDAGFGGIPEDMAQFSSRGPAVFGDAAIVLPDTISGPYGETSGTAPIK